MSKFRINIFSINSLVPPKSSFSGGGLLLMSVWFFFLYTVFSGAVRKWGFGPGATSNVIFFLQMLMPFILFIVVTSFSTLRNSFSIPLSFFVFLLYLILCAFNPKNATVYHGLFGLLIYLGFWLGLVAYYLKREFFEIEKLIGFFVIVLLIEIVLGSIQYSLPGDHILNIVGDGKPADDLVGMAVRVSGTFNYIGGFQVLVIFYGFLIWFLIVMEYPIALIGLVFGLSTYGALISGSRGTMLMLLLISGFAFIYTGFLFKRFFNILMIAIFFLILLGVFGDKILNSYDEAYENFSERVEWGQESGETEIRLVSLYSEVTNFKGKYPIFGIGLGSTYQGANILYGESVYAKEYGYYEVESGRIILEGGYILFLLRIYILFVFLSYSFIPWPGKLVIFIFYLINVVVFNTYLSVFFLLGLMLVDRAYYLKSKAGATGASL